MLNNGEDTSVTFDAINFDAVGVHGRSSQHNQYTSMRGPWRRLWDPVRQPSTLVILRGPICLSSF